MLNELGKAVGTELPAISVSWNKRDALLYAVGIGAKRTDLPIVYESDRRFATFPTYPVVLGFKGDSQDVVNFAQSVGNSTIPSLPKLDPNRIVHASQSIEILRPLPTHKIGIVIDSEAVLVDPSGTPYAKMMSSSFNVGAKAMGTKFSKTIAQAPVAKPIPKDRKADYIVTERTTEEQALVYRLSGDYNPLHIGPSIGKAAGFGGVILHGLTTFGFAARAVVSKVGAGDSPSLRTFGARFTSPIKPGDTLETSI